MKRLTLICIGSMVGILVPLGAAHAQTPTYTAVFGSQSPNPAPPSSTVVWNVTFTRTAASNVNIGVDLQGTAGQGTLSNFTTNAGGACVGTGGNGFRCDWQPGDPNVAVLTFTLNLGPDAAPPDWGLRAVLDDGAATGTVLASQSVVIQQPATTTTAAPTTTTTSPAPTNPATTTSPAPTNPATTAPVTTSAAAGGAAGSAGSTGSLPATGNETTWIAIMSLLAFLAGALLVRVARRPAGAGQHD